LAGQASGTPSRASPAASPGQTGAPPTATTSGATLLTWGPAGQAPGHLHPGQFEFGSFRPALSFELDGTKGQGADWWFTCGRPDFVTISAWDTGKAFPGVGEFDLPDNDDPCYWQGVGKPEVDILRAGSVGGGECTEGALVRNAQDLFEWLSKISVLDTSEPQQVIVAGQPALSIETTLVRSGEEYCHAGEVPLTILRTSEEPLQIQPGDRAQFIVVDTGEALPVLIHVEAPVADWSTAQARVQPVLDSLTIGD